MHRFIVSRVLIAVVARRQNLLEEKRRQEARQGYDAAIAIYEKLLSEAIKAQQT